MYLEHQKHRWTEVRRKMGIVDDKHKTVWLYAVPGEKYGINKFRQRTSPVAQSIIVILLKRWK